jgi:hypothetical protein
MAPDMPSKSNHTGNPRDEAGSMGNSYFRDEEFGQVSRRREFADFKP